MNPAPVNLIRDYLDNVQVHLDTVQYTKVSTSWGSVLPMPEVTRLYFIRDGAGWISIQNHHFVTQPGQLFLLPAGRPLSFDTDPTHPLVKYWCHFTATVGDINLFHLIDLPYVVTVPSPNRWTDRFQELIVCNHDSSLPNTLRIKAILLELLSGFVEQALAEGAQVGPRANSEHLKLELLLHYIEEHLESRIAIADLAKIAHFHPQYLSPYFKSVMGVSPMVYVNRKRIEKAKRWLWESDLSIREIAERLGLEGYYFSRLFKHHTGISPSAYRASRVFE